MAIPVFSPTWPYKKQPRGKKWMGCMWATLTNPNTAGPDRASGGFNFFLSLEWEENMAGTGKRLPPSLVCSDLEDLRWANQLKLVGCKHVKVSWLSKKEHSWLIYGERGGSQQAQGNPQSARCRRGAFKSVDRNIAQPNYPFSIWEINLGMEWGGKEWQRMKREYKEILVCLKQ